MTTPISRRQFFRLRPRSAARLMAEDQEKAALSPPATFIRPPGALQPESMFKAMCDHCGACVEACPHDVIHLLGPEHGPDEGTPILDPNKSACRWCQDFPCIAACPTPALATPPQGGPLPMALAHINLDLCLNAQGTLCDDCATACPGSIRAIRITDHRPVLDAERCVGCGLCVDVCPAQPIAISVSPRIRT